MPWKRGSTIHDRVVFTSWDDVPVIMDLPLAACIIGCNCDYLRRLAKEGKFPAKKFGKVWRVDKDELRETIKQLPQQ